MSLAALSTRRLRVVLPLPSPRALPKLTCQLAHLQLAQLTTGPSLISKHRRGGNPKGREGDELGRASSPRSAEPKPTVSYEKYAAINSSKLVAPVLPPPVPPVPQMLLSPTPVVGGALDYEWSGGFIFLCAQKSFDETMRKKVP